MTITAFATFVTALGDVSVAGVTRAYDGPPEGVETADLPASFPAALAGDVMDEGYLTVQTHGGWPHMRANLVVLLEEAGQNTVLANHAATVAMVDAVATALRGVSIGTLAKGAVTWSIGLTANFVLGDRRYWALVAEVRAHG